MNKSAKELKEELIEFIDSQKTPINVYYDISKYTKFLDIFDQFCKQHAKEQRLLCSREFNMTNASEVFKNAVRDFGKEIDLIINAPEPEL